MQRGEGDEHSCRARSCNPRPGGSCGNCSRRYPPVDCIFLPDPRKPKDKPHSGEPQAGAIPASTTRDEHASSSSRSPRYSVIPLSAILEPSDGVVSRGGYQVSPHSELELEVASTLSSSLGSDTAGARRSDTVFSSDTKSTPSIDDTDSSPNPEKDRHLQIYKLSSTSPIPFAGTLTQINGMHGAYVKSTMRNVELWNFFHHFVVPNMCSVDGSNTPALFIREILPWTIQSPLMPHIAILMSSTSQTAEPNLQVAKASETFAIKSQVLALINEYLKQDFALISTEALRAVIHLVVMEWWWGTSSSLWAHMKGVRQMIKLKGGFPYLNDPVLQQVLLVTDFELACCFERDLLLVDPVMATHMDLSIPPTYAEILRSPLLAYHETFQHDRMALGLSAEAAEILDDVRFLTLSITSASHTSSPTKIQSTAAWLHKQISTSPPLTHDPTSPPTTITTTTSAIRLIATLYTLSISTLTPISQHWTSSLLEDFYFRLFSLSMSQWKQIPGIFLWIMLVASTGGWKDEDEQRKKWLWRKMAVAGMQVGMEDFGVSIASLRSFWRVQRWVEEEGRGKTEVSNLNQASDFEEPLAVNDD
ncbi:uncharacterized protein PAC_17972 [Phialocephala subalpina]|uniref:Uncharacterized protein n=1 Tax=Phialocephala subalpina TaxID=576137 RepID=A0A1L7XSR3_9HELO|nr:uncharacterized protein PAC_17972 [Phialocephala subalpina]